MLLKMGKLQRTEKTTYVNQIWLMPQNNNEGIVIAEFTNEEGSIIRVGIRKGIISKTISLIKT